MQRNSIIKQGILTMLPSKLTIINWLKSLFHQFVMGTKIQEFGDGVIYCKLMNYFYGNPSSTKITWLPKNQYEYVNNLKHVQNALIQLGINISFDVARIAKRKFLENWTLINAFYKHFNTHEQLSFVQQNSVSSHGNHSITQIPQIPHLHQIHSSIQPSTQIQPNSLHPQKVRKRSESQVHQQQSHSTQKLPPKIYQSLLTPQPPLIWDNGLTTGLGQISNNSLQIAQYLKQNISPFQIAQNSGKWSVGSQILQNNHSAVIDRIKQILLKGLNDIQKIRQIKMLLGMPLQQQQIVKIQDDINDPIVYIPSQIQKDDNKESIQIIIKEKQNNNQVKEKSSLTKINKKPFKI